MYSRQLPFVKKKMTKKRVVKVVPSDVETSSGRGYLTVRTVKTGEPDVHQSGL